MSHTLAPLYSDNQTTKFVIGLARAGRGELARDWLAGRADPLPPFTALVTLTYRFLPEAAFYAYFTAAAGVFLYALHGIADRAAGLRRSPARGALFLAALLVLYSRLAIHLAAAWGVGDLPSLFRRGLAGQYVLGPVFQPCVFGVLLLLAVRLFLEDRRYPAAAALAVAAVFHPAYLLTALALLAAFTIPAGGRRPALGPALVFLVLVGPVAVATRVAFAPVDPTLWRQGLRFLVHERIPHHAVASVWFHGGEVFQVLLMAAGILAAGDRRLRLALAVPFAAGLALTVIQVATGSDALALVAPWRVSAILVPASVAVLLARLVAVMVPVHPRAPARRTALAVAAMVVAVTVAAGVHFQWTAFRDRARSPAAALFAYVRGHLAPGDLYLVPPRDDALDPFRLDAGAPILVNWKSHPYRLDDELAEWRRRMERADRVYAAPAGSVCAAAEALARTYGITHVVLPREGDDPGCPGWREVYRNPGYAVYRLPRLQAATLPLGSEREVP